MFHVKHNVFINHVFRNSNLLENNKNNVSRETVHTLIHNINKLSTLIVDNLLKMWITYFYNLLLKYVSRETIWFKK